MVYGRAEVRGNKRLTGQIVGDYVMMSYWQSRSATMCAGRSTTVSAGRLSALDVVAEAVNNDVSWQRRSSPDVVAEAVG
jgi:hypothetical protein